MRLAMVCVVCCIVCYYVTQDAQHGQAHSQQHAITQYDMLPQHPVNIKELFCECFKITLARNNIATWGWS